VNFNDTAFPFIIPFDAMKPVRDNSYRLDEKKVEVVEVPDPQ